VGLPPSDSILDRLRRLLAPQYAVEHELAAGGMGVVFLGTDVVLERRVAIKVLQPEYASAVARRRFEREARVLAKLQHPNIVAVHTAGPAEDFWYFVMDYIEGPTLAQRLKDGPLELEAVRAVGRDLLDALHYAHRAKVIHRDVKPANLLVRDGRILLADFGIASVGDTSDSSGGALTTPGQRMGTPAYWAPEQMAGGEATARTDIYAAGLVLYEACTGERWKPATDPAHGDWERVPRELRQPLRKALAIAPEMRWRNAAAFRRAISRRPVPLLVPASLALLLGLLVYFLLWPSPPPSPVTPLTDFAIVPFARTDRDDPVGRSLAQYAGNDLEYFTRWRLTSVPASFAWWDSAGPNRRAAEAPAALRARFYAEGELLDGRTLQISIRDSTGAPYYRFTITGSETDLLAWSGAIADSIVQVVFPEYLEEYRALAGYSSRNLAARNELFAGEEAFRIDDWTAAESHYRRALELDSTFGQAAWELALVRRWRERSFETEWRRLYEQRERLPGLQRLIIEAQLETDLPTRFAALASAVHRYPRSAEGMLLLADELHHRGPLIGLSLDSALVWWDSAAHLRPYFTAYAHAAVGGTRLGDRARARAALRELHQHLGASGEEAHRRAKLIALVYDGRFHPWLARWELRLFGWRADSAGIGQLAQYARLGLVFDAPEAQRQAGEILTRRGADALTRANGHEAAGIALMAEGQASAAIAEVDSAAALFGTPETALERAEWRLLPATLGLPSSDTASVAWARRTLAAAAQGPQAARASWDLAVDADASGDSTALARWRGRLDTAAADAPGAASLALVVAALIRAHAGDLRGALVSTDSLARTSGAGLAQAPFARALLHLRRGEWLARTGAVEQADRTWLWYEGWDIEGWAQRGVEAGEVDAVAGGLARVRRAELAAQRGDSAARCTQATRARQLWARAEPPYAELLKRASALGAGCHG
jgi:serine/threonine protein kinase